MKRLLALILVLTLLVVTGTIVSADGQTRRENEVRSQGHNRNVANVITDVTNNQY